MPTFHTRIKNKIDTYQNWTENNPTPLNGEICIAVVPASTGAVKQEPAVLIKVGNGTDDFNTLPFVSAKAADVSSWALADKKPTYSAGEITGIDAYIAEYVETEMGISIDTDTQYTIIPVAPVDGKSYQFKLMSKSKGDQEFTVEVASFEIPEFDHADMDAAIEANADAIEVLNGDAETVGSVAKAIADAIAALKLDETYEKVGVAAEEAGKVQSALDEYKLENDEIVEAVEAAVEKAQGDVDALASKVGEVPADKTVVQMIAEAQNAATYDDTELTGRVTANEEAIALLNDEATVEGSVDYKIAQAVAAIMENPDETMNSINELVTWINGHADDALELSNQVAANVEDISALDELIGGTDVATQIANAIAAALTIEGIDKYALATELTAAIGRIAAMEAKVATWDSAEQNAKKHANELNTAMNARVEALEAIDHEHENASVLNGITAAKVTAWDGAERNAKEYAKGLDEAMGGRMNAAEDKLTTLTGTDTVEGSVAKALKDAKAYTDELDAELKPVAKSGLISDLTQTQNTYIIFDCGTATTVI